MTLLDLLKLIRHYLKLVIILPIVCAVLTAAVFVFMPSTYTAKATLLTNGDIALAGGYIQSAAAVYSQNGIEVTSKTDTSYKTITVTAQGNDYGGCIAAANATVLAAAEGYRNVNSQISVTTNEATFAENTGSSMPKTVLAALLAGFFVAICIVIIIDVVKAPIKSRNDIEAVSNLSVIGTIPNLDRGERLLANIRFLREELPSVIAVVPVGLSGGTLTCAELSSAFERAGIAVTRIKGNPHAEGLNHTRLPGVVALVECAPLSQGMGAAYIAKEADMTILCASEWQDSCKALTFVVEELNFAKAKLGGVVYIAGRHRSKSTI